VSAAPLRIALVYDCLYPYTVGGLERWYRTLAARLAVRHEVTYLTRRQWDADAVPDAPAGVRVVPVSGGGPLYTAGGRRRLGPPLAFGWGVYGHLRRYAQAYDVVHTASFPYFPLLAARAAAGRHGQPVVVDWVEVWTRAYWRDYLGPVAGVVGAGIERLCVRLTSQACVLSELHAGRLRAAGLRHEPVRLRGLYDGAPGAPAAVGAVQPLVVFVGRHIREKGVVAVPAAIAAARRRRPELRAVIFGDGPERPRVQAEIARLGLQGIVGCPGFAPWADVDAALRHAVCLVLPSVREGYGLAVVEAAARGTPTVLVPAPDNAATELLVAGENGILARSAAPADLADAVVTVADAGADLRRRTAAWFAANGDSLTADRGVAAIEALYARALDPPAGAGAARPRPGLLG